MPFRGQNLTPAAPLLDAHPPPAQKGLPLSILSVQPTAHAFADLEPFPPTPSPAGEPPPRGSPALQFSIAFESSGKWPDDLTAIAALKAAFYLRLANLLEEQAKVTCEVHAGCLYAQIDSFTFVGVIQHDATAHLLEKAGDASAAMKLQWQTALGAKHVSALTALGRAKPAYPPAVRLAKRWLACQMQSGVLTDALVALLVAHGFTSTVADRAPASAAAGFVRFLQLLVTSDFENEPVLVVLGDTPMTTAQQETAAAAFAAARATAANASTGITGLSGPSPDPEIAAVGQRALPTIWVATDEQPNGADGVAPGPPWNLVARLRAVAASALGQMDRAMNLDFGVVVALSTAPGGTTAAGQSADEETRATAPKDAAEAAAMATDRGLQALVGHVFDPPLADFDALLNLVPAKLSKAHLSWVPTTEDGGAGRGGEVKKYGKSAQSAFANLRHGAIGSGVGQDDVATLVSQLRSVYGSLALFFYDGEGGRTIAIKWRPAAFLPAPLRSAEAQHRTLVPRTDAKTDDDSGGSEVWALPNIPDVLAGIVQLGGGLIKGVRLIPSSHGLA